MGGPREKKKWVLKSRIPGVQRTKRYSSMVIMGKSEDGTHLSSPSNIRLAGERSLPAISRSSPQSIIGWLGSSQAAAAGRRSNPCSSVVADGSRRPRPRRRRPRHSSEDPSPCPPSPRGAGISRRPRRSSEENTSPCPLARRGSGPTPPRLHWHWRSEDPPPAHDNDNNSNERG